ncbi:MAG: 2-succinyl-5-enolpyruvyl-6-hydroxy-3-cyclohexene-1-carboxylic-acid synthase [Deltaproteobacteria bacterium]|nr:2-succinyl-5-enolpyruvyl-6-hydroxy-3-cyclohexene-1-carboxylic-acid synthase [Deltaproteobacteria bacterium]
MRAADPAATATMTAEFFRALVAGGVRHCVLSPGSRSAPLAVAALRCEPLGLRIFVQLDERSAGFFARGLAMASGAPTLLLCTSGTAAANYFPAVIEAHYGGTPLIVLSADRPPELRDCDAGQTIDQVRLYGSHVRWFHELPLPEAGAAAERVARSVANRALAHAQGANPGPVHLNWPLREPLTPPHGLAPLAPLASENVLARNDLPSPSLAEIDALAALTRREERGVIVAGPLPLQSDLADAAVRFSRASGWPVLADAASQLRFGAHVESANVAAAYELYLRDGAFARAHAPRAVLRLGSAPTSKALRVWLESHAPSDYWLIDSAARFSDVSRLATARSASDPGALLTHAADALGDRARVSRWQSAFANAERAAQAAVAHALDAEAALLEPHLARELAAALPDGALLALSNSMPVRDVDAFAPASSRRLRVLVNRGANGIDGVTSTALGASAAWPGPVALLTGDLAFLHDLGGLAAVRDARDLTIVLIENGGGGIFSFLPIAEHRESIAFERLFHTPHGLPLRKASELFGIEWERVGSWEHFRAALKTSLARGGVSVIEVPVDPAANVTAFRALARVAQDAAAEACA